MNPAHTLRRRMAHLPTQVGRDLRLAVRGLARRPVFAITAVVTLAVGVGMTATMFTLLDGVALRPLPGSNARGLVYLELETDDGQMSMSPSPDLLRTVRDHRSAFAQVEGYGMRDVTTTMGGEPLRLRVAQASDRFFAFLGITPEIGRLFLPGDGRAEAGPVMVLSYRFWTERLGGSPDVLGTVLNVDDHSYVVVGVLPGDFKVDASREAEAWVPDGAPGTLSADEVSLSGALARLADGVTLERARSELDAAVANNPLPRRANRTWVGKLKPPAALVDPDLRRALVLLQAGAVLVLLIACGNLANLLLAQGEDRAREFALRSSLGAGRGRLVAQLLTEFAVLGLAGAFGGMLLTYWSLKALPHFLPPGFAVLTVHRDGLALSLGVALAGIVIAGLAPALRGSRRNVSALISGSWRTSGRAFPAGRRLLVAVQVAMAFVLLFSSGLLYKSFSGLLASDVGFPRQDLLSLRLPLPAESYPDAESRRRFTDRLRDRLSADLPDQLGSATVATGLVEGLSVTVAPVGSDTRTESEQKVLMTWGVAPNYFEVLGLPLVAGRGFDERDGEGAERVVVIGQEVARRYFADVDPVGRQLLLDDEPLRVVGVAGDIRLPALAGSIAGDLQLFFPLRAQAASDLTILTRVRGDRATAMEQVKQAVRGIDPTLPFRTIALVEDALSESLRQERANTLLTVIFAGTALLLGAVGIYGIVAYTVGRQVREIGIRVALGATGRGEVARVVRRGMRTVGIGLALGVAAALVLGPTLGKLLHDVSARDIQVSVGTALLVAAVALVATWIPARKAAAAQPSDALRAE